MAELLNTRPAGKPSGLFMASQSLPALRRAAKTDRSLKARRVGAGTASWASTTKETARAGPSTGAVLTMLSRPSTAGARHASHLSGYTRLVAVAGPDRAAAVLARVAGSLHQITLRAAGSGS